MGRVFTTQQPRFGVEDSGGVVFALIAVQDAMYGRASAMV